MINLYLIGNDIVDGVIMMGAYTVLPLSITSVLSSFTYSFVAGNRYANLTLVSLFSPLYMAGELLTAIVGNEKTDFIFIVGLIGGFYIVPMCFAKRKEPISVRTVSSPIRW